MTTPLKWEDLPDLRPAPVGNYVGRLEAWLDSRSSLTSTSVACRTNIN